MKKRVLNFFAALAMIFSFAGVMPEIDVKATQDRTGYFNKSYSLSGNGADDIVAVAMAQKNRTKAQMGYTEPWCADFVSDCAKLANVRNKIPADGYCGNLYTNIKNAGGIEVSSPQKGDIIFYYCNASYCPNSGKPWVHVGIMTSQSSSIEGNSGGKVSYKQTISYTDCNGHTYNHSGYNSVTVKYLRPKYGNIPPILPGTVDTSYATPANVTASHKCSTYDQYGNVESGRYISAGDNCYIDAVYTNGFVHIRYPAGNTQRWTYAKLSDMPVAKKNLPGKTNVYCNVGTEYYPTVFSWDTASSASSYDLKIWKGTVWQGDAYKIIWSIEGTRYTLNLPAGYYEAYIDSRNSNGITMSNNVVKFTVGNASPLDLGTDFYAYITNTLANKPIVNDGGNVCIRSKNGNANQIWKFVRQSDKSYKIINCMDGNILDVTNFGTTDGTNVGMCVNNDSTAQRWFIYEKSGVYYLRAKCGGLVLDVNGAKTADGTNVQMWTSNASDAQKFKIEKTSCPHKWNNWSTTKNATCTADGQKTRKCSICGKTETAAIAKTGHKYESKVIAPTCTEKGYTLYTCSVCKNSYKDKYTDIISHKWSDWTTSKAATCIEDGSKTRKCSVCGKIETAAIAKSGHKYESKVISPTCTAKGYTLYTCAVCQNSYKDNYVNAKGHSFEAKDENGSKIYTCSGCKFTYNVTFKGDGTAESPYLIANKNDLICLSELMQNETTALLFRTKHYLQTSDIDLQNMDWTPIGICYVNGNVTGMYFEEGFVYDGGNHNIFNLNVNGGRVFSGLFGKINNGTVKNLAVYGNVNSTTKENNCATGGIVGELGYTGKIMNCSFVGNVISDNNSGGIAGKMWRGGTIENCYSRGNIEGKRHSGGITAFMNQSDQAYVINYSIKNCYFAGSVKNENAGAICGGWLSEGKSSGNDTEKIENCYYLKSSAEKGLGSGTITKDDSTALISPILKQISPDLGECFAEKTYTGINNEYPIFTWQVPSKVKGDLDNNGRVNVSDAVAIQKCLTGKCMISDGQFVTADMNNDGILNAFDMVLAKRALEVN